MGGRHAVAGLICLLALGCEGGAPGEPAGLGLREALVSSPDSIAALPLETRMSLALRLEAAVDGQRASELVDGSERAAHELLEAFDAPREERGEDAVVALAVERDPAAARLHTLAGAGPDAGAVDVPDLRLSYLDPALQDDPYARALAGPAREVLQRMARQTGARDVTLGEPMPTGLIGDADTLVVNPTWLVLLATLDAHEAVGRRSAPLIEPASHHRTDSSGWGCYGSVCTSSGACSLPGCGRCGCDCGECAYECGPGSDGVHCHAARRARSPASPLDGVWLLVPVAYLWLRRRR